MRFKPLVLVCGADEIGSAVVHRLFQAKFRVGLVGSDNPLTMIKGNSYAGAAFNGSAEVEGVMVRKAVVTEAIGVIDRDSIPIMSANIMGVMEVMNPEIVIDARLTHMKEDIQVGDASLVIGIGAGRIARDDCDIVINAFPGYELGRVVYRGSVKKDPTVSDIDENKVLIKAPVAGVFSCFKRIGQSVMDGEKICSVGDTAINAKKTGVIRGLLNNGVEVPEGITVVEVDTSGIEDLCYAISSVGRSIAGGVLEAVTAWVADVGAYDP